MIEQGEETALKPKLTLEPEGPEIEECRAAFAEQFAFERKLASVEFERCYARRFGGSNDEVIEGRRPEHWARLKHYLLAFHDQYFECLAEGYEVELVTSSFRDAVAGVTGRLFEK